MNDTIQPRVRIAVAGDVAAIATMIKELAHHLNSSDQVTMTQDKLDRALFGHHRVCSAHIVEMVDGANVEVAGYGLWYTSFSTWVGEPGMVLDDIYIRPQFRRNGLGQVLMSHLAALCIDEGYSRFEWRVLRTNEPAIKFYEELGARELVERTSFRLDGIALERLASRSVNPG